MAVENAAGSATTYALAGKTAIVTGGGSFNLSWKTVTSRRSTEALRYVDVYYSS